MERLVAIDSSTKKTGAALFVDGKLKEYELIDLSKNSSTDERINIMGKSLCTLLSHWKPTVIVIEEPNGGHKNIMMYRLLAEIIGMVRLWAFTHGSEFEEVKPSVWRKQIGIKQGRKTRIDLKADSMDYVKNTFGLNVNDDVADAICIGASVFV